jgi:hypothetical protein
MFQPRPGFDWNRVKWTGPLAPIAEACSYCGAAIDEEADYIPLRLWRDTGWAAVFCEDCMVTWFGFSRQGTPDPEIFP